MIRSLKLSAVVGLLFIIFISGMYAYKVGIHRNIFYFYYDQYTKKAIRVKVFADGGYKYPYAEKELIKQLENNRPHPTSLGTDEFDKLIIEALGWKNIVPKLNRQGRWKLDYSGSDDFGIGKITELTFSYKNPPLSPKALYAEHIDQAKILAVVLHGHGSTMQKTMGLDAPDYMDAIGSYLFDKGFDVITFGTTGHMGNSSTLSRLLRFYNISLYGFWTKNICDAVGSIRSKYSKIYVYGLSNGGTIADLLSVTCEPFDLVIVGDTFTDWGTRMWREHQTRGDYFLYWIRPFVSQTTIYDLMKHTKSKKVYTTAKSNYLALSKKINFQELKLSNKNKVNVFFKLKIGHNPEIDIMEKLFEDSISGLEGVGIDIALD